MRSRSVAVGGTIGRVPASCGGAGAIGATVSPSRRHAARRVARLQRSRLGALDLVEDAAVAGVQHDARHRQQRLVGVLVHQVAAHREDVLARAEFLAAQAAVLAQRLDRLLQVLHIGRGLLVDDDEIGQQAARAHIFLVAQRLRDDLEVGDVADPQAKIGKSPEMLIGHSADCWPRPGGDASRTAARRNGSG